MMPDVMIVPATEQDFNAIWNIFKAVIAPGDSYIYEATTSKEEAHAILMVNTSPYVAKIGNEIVGFYLIRQNRIGRGSHVCNAAYMVNPHYQNQKIGRLMGEHSLKEAKKLGYHAMQFNIVVSTNARAVHLWQSLGFHIIGTVPKAFNHQEKGLVDIYVMHRFL